MDGREAESAGDGNKLEPIDRGVGGEVVQGDDSDAREDEHKEHRQTGCAECRKDADCGGGRDEAGYGVEESVGSVAS